MADIQIDVDKVAHLARLHLTDDEKSRFGDQLRHVLGYMESLNAVDVADVAPMHHPMPLANVFRPDAVQPSLSPADALRNAPAQANGLFLVPLIVE